MEKNTRKKAEVAVIAVILILLFVSIPAMYLMAGVPLMAIAVTTVIYIALAAGIAYYSHQRMTEIEEGLEDAVDNYREHPRQDLRDNRDRQGKHDPEQEHRTRHRPGPEIRRRRRAQDLCRNDERIPLHRHPEDGGGCGEDGCGCRRDDALLDIRHNGRRRRGHGLRHRREIRPKPSEPMSGAFAPFIFTSWKTAPPLSLPHRP